MAQSVTSYLQNIELEVWLAHDTWYTMVAWQRVSVQARRSGCCCSNDLTHTHRQACIHSDDYPSAVQMASTNCTHQLNTHAARVLTHSVPLACMLQQNEVSTPYGRTQLSGLPLMNVPVLRRGPS